MPESRGAAKFAPGIKFIAAVYMAEISIGLLIVVWILSTGAP